MASTADLEKQGDEGKEAKKEYTSKDIGVGRKKKKGSRCMEDGHGHGRRNLHSGLAAGVLEAVSQAVVVGKQLLCSLHIDLEALAQLQTRCIPSRCRSRRMQKREM